MASLGGRRLHAQHVAAAYQRNKMKLQRGSYGVWRGGSGCGCGVIAVAASEAKYVKNDVVEGGFMFHNTEAVMADMKKQHGEEYIEGFMRGFDQSNVRIGDKPPVVTVDEITGEESSEPGTFDEEGMADGLAAYEACIAAGIEEVNKPKVRAEQLEEAS